MTESHLSPAERLLSEAYRFDFFQAVRLMGRLYQGREPVGGPGPPEREVVRFRTHPSLAFPPSEICDIAEGAKGRPEAPLEMTVAFAGLTGPERILPDCYTELLVDRVRQKDTALWAFLDLFQHRLLSFFYRAWEKHRFPVAWERGGDEPFTTALFALVGLGTPGLQGRAGVPDASLLLWAGLVSQKPHSPAALTAILEDAFGVPVALEPYWPQWLSLDEESRSRVGTAHATLGGDLICGDRILDRQSKFRLRLGPLTLRQFVAFLPTGRLLAPAVSISRLIAGLELDFDLQLVLLAAEVPDCRLGGTGLPPMLGWTTWLKTKELTEDASPVVLTPFI